MIVIIRYFFVGKYAILELMLGILMLRHPQATGFNPPRLLFRWLTFFLVIPDLEAVFQKKYLSPVSLKIAKILKKEIKEREDKRLPPDF